MATAGYGMKWGAGYRNKQEPDAKGAEAGEEHQEGTNDGEEHHGAIQEHLKAMHAATGHGHSHIEHKGDGSHVAHHISHDGQMSGPEEHGDCPGGMCGGM